MSQLSYFDRPSQFMKASQFISSKDIALEVIDEMVQLVMDTVTEEKNESKQIINNVMIEQNMGQLRKKVFIKENIVNVRETMGKGFI